MIQNNTVKVTLKIRHDITENWSENNPILAIGEFGLDDSTSLLKIGNGTTHWNELPYLNKIDNTKLKHLPDGSLTFSDEFLEELAQAGIGPLQPGSSTTLGGVKSSTDDNFIRIISNNDITGVTAGFMTLNRVSTSLLFVPQGDLLILDGGNSIGGV